MYEFHKDKERYFKYQYWTARDHIIPFVSAAMELTPDKKILEIGCAEAGVLKAFLERGHHCTGIELSEGRTGLAKQFHRKALDAGKIRFVNKDIYNINIEKDLGHRFDLIILKDVIEHIPNQEKMIPKLREFLNPGGQIFFGFPPWYMPFGGHQQICDSKLLKVTPWFHLLPAKIYSGILKTFGERPRIRQELLEIKATGITIERFEKIVKQNHYQIRRRKFFVTNPIYKYKFGWNTKEQSDIISAIPVLRNVCTTAVYYLIG